MKLTPTPITGVYVIDLEPRGDDRGWFARVWCQRELEEAGLLGSWVQCNGSYSRHAGTLRGLHYQAAPHEEAKLIRCISGSIYDVVADVRPDSPTFGKWLGVELTAQNRQMLYVAPGVAHGYQTLEDDSEVLYPVTEFYTPSHERGVRWNDPFFSIEWPHVGNRVISAKDESWPDFAPLTARR
jgi:dTDP-4-dehydrorhamnose 3,5-epimerase